MRKSNSALQAICWAEFLIIVPRGIMFLTRSSQSLAKTMQDIILIKQIAQTHLF